jgi:LysM repeat protein
MPASPPISLRIADLTGGTRELIWQRPKLQIGSHPTSDLVLPGRGVAEYHCALEATPGGPVLRDRGSRTGTFVNSERLTEPRALRPGDRIYIGEYQLELLVSAEPEPPTAVTAVLPALPRAPTRARRRGPALAVLLLGLAGAAWFAWAAATTGEPRTPVTTRAARSAAEPAVLPAIATPAPRVKTVVHHEVIPGETIADIAARYGVSASRLIDDHGLNPDVPPPPGTELVFEAIDPPLPRLRLRHVLEPGDTLTGIGERFGIDVELLRRYNPDLRDELVPGEQLVIWVDPQIERRHDEPVRLSFPVATDALSIGAPTSGSLEHGIQLPASDQYERVHPALQYGSSHAIAQLQLAIAGFRQRYRYAGVLVISDLSQEGGGKLPPHSSHQSGRDVDIWLPALKGTYQRRHLAEDRKPRHAEINWYAAWALVESLLATGQVQYIFLDQTLLPSLYRAAERLGAPPELLTQIQWQPEGTDPLLAQRARYHAPVRHADAHTGHIHVRFKCGPLETRCTQKADAELEAP